MALRDHGFGIFFAPNYHPAFAIAPARVHAPNAANGPFWFGPVVESAGPTDGAVDGRAASRTLEPIAQVLPIARPPARDGGIGNRQGSRPAQSLDELSRSA